ncbi:MAG: transcription elongation factor GreA [Deltaproteobacteria bacterium]|nr:transcription elongation factor GreA [Deltaproteobacteria bacterium]
MEKVPFTPDGYAALKEELKRLKTVERPKVSKEIGKAREHGDLRENAEYKAAKEHQGVVEARIRDLEDKLVRAEVIDPSKIDGTTVKFGARVKLQDIESGNAVEYHIVGPYEADLENGSISVLAPLAKALIGREVGDQVEVRVPKGIRTFEILNIRWK